MILKNDFYHIAQASVDLPRATYEIALNAQHFIYQAHFPGEPITPGVCILQMACELLGEALHRPLALCGVKNVKFLSVLIPTETENIVYQFSGIEEQPDGTVKAKVNVVSGTTGYAKLSFTCQPCKE